MTDAPNITVPTEAAVPDDSPHPRGASKPARGGFKRQRNGERKQTLPPTNSPFMPMFEGFRNELDEHHDRRERVIKTSRDVTALSKKIIFSLQRVRTLGVPLPEHIGKECDERLAQIHALLDGVAADVGGIRAWRYQGQLSGGLQEMVEAVTMMHYVRQQALLSPGATASQLTAGATPVMLTSDDYLLGIFDLVGEMMRFAITGLATMGQLPAAEGEDDDDQMDEDDAEAPRTILTDLQDIRTHFESLDFAPAGGFLARDASKKMEVMKTCVEKVEMAAYGMIVRGSERPQGWVPDLSSDMPVEGY